MSKGYNWYAAGAWPRLRQKMQEEAARAKKARAAKRVVRKGVRRAYRRVAVEEARLGHRRFMKKAEKAARIAARVERKASWKAFYAGLSKPTTVTAPFVVRVDELMLITLQVAEERLEKFTKAHEKCLKVWEMEMTDEQRKLFDREMKKIEIEMISKRRYAARLALRFAALKNDKGDRLGRWFWRKKVFAPGLLEIVSNLTSVSHRTVVVQLLNELPKEQQKNGSWRRPDVPVPAMRAAEAAEGYMLSKGKYIFPEGPALDLMREMFPLAIDFKSYGHSLYSTVEEYLGLVECVVKNLGRGKDGSGFAHPDIIGKTPVQIRGIGEEGTGLFSKGMLFPNVNCVSADGTPEVWLDVGQFKGREKNVVKDAVKHLTEFSLNLHLGVLRRFDQPGEIKLGYQQLQLLAGTDATNALMKRWVDESMADLGKKGVEGLLQGLAADDEDIARVLQVCKSLGQNPMAVPSVREAVQGRLKKQLYFIACGTGKKGRNMVVCIDDRVPAGSVVMRGLKPGVKVVGFRFPTILPQSLRVLTGFAPFSDMLIDEKIVANTVFMNPMDIVACQQGDDDGDTIGIIEDPEFVQVVESSRCDNGSEQIYAIEPESKKLPFLTTSEEGKRYIAQPHNNAVGKMSVLQAKLWALGRHKEAIAMGFAIQEAVDSQKNDVEYTDVPRAVNAWLKPVDGITKSKAPKIRFGDERYSSFFTENGEFLAGEYEKYLTNWVKRYLRGAGALVTNEDGWEVEVWSPTDWRSSDKAIDPTNWKMAHPLANVSRVYNYARAVWQKRIAEKFDFNVEPISAEVADHITEKLGVVGPRFDDMQAYQRALRAKSGLRKWGQDLRASAGMDPEVRTEYLAAQWEKCAKKLRMLSTEELESVVYHEIKFSALKRGKDTDSIGNVNYAFRVLSFEGSPLGDILGADGSCKFLSRERLERLTQMVMGDNGRPDLEKVALTMLQAKQHFVSTGKHGWECPTCMKKLTTSLIVRSREDLINAEMAADLISQLGGVQYPLG